MFRLKLIIIVACSVVSQVKCGTRNTLVPRKPAHVLVHGPDGSSVWILLKDEQGHVYKYRAEKNTSIDVSVVGGGAGDDGDLTAATPASLIRPSDISQQKRSGGGGGGGGGGGEDSATPGVTAVTREWSPAATEGDDGEDGTGPGWQEAPTDPRTTGADETTTTTTTTRASPVHVTAVTHSPVQVTAVTRVGRARVAKKASPATTTTVQRRTAAVTSPTIYDQATACPSTDSGETPVHLSGATTVTSVLPPARRCAEDRGADDAVESADGGETDYGVLAVSAGPRETLDGLILSVENNIRFRVLAGPCGRTPEKRSVGPDRRGNRRAAKHDENRGGGGGGGDDDDDSPAQPVYLTRIPDGEIRT